jgi:2-keto-4-pentenoate hydratase/2-oxohepta-3-ene-1,7-dioic acid hydratase in catechol pathway
MRWRSLGLMLLKPGDVVKLWIEKIGTLTNTMA